MKCKNCGAPRSAHIKKPLGPDSAPIWECPNGSGDTFPAMLDTKVELHYRAGDDHPWIARWVHPLHGADEATADGPTEALQSAGREIERLSEEKSAEEIAVEKAIGKG
jgi:hypothetical protein